MISRPDQPGMDAFARRMAAAVSARVGAARYRLWFEAHATFVASNGELHVVVPTAHFQEWLAQTFGDAVTAAAEEVFAKPVPVRFVVDPVLFGVQSAPEAPTPAGSPRPQKNLFGEAPPPLPRKKHAETTARRWKLLSEFVVGASNRVAHASAVGVIEDPGMGANPLVIHGPVGTGKTHLLEGVYAALRKRHGSEGRPCYVTAEEFTTRFVQATRFGKQSSFRRQFRDCSALLLDDLHFLATKRGTQEEFLHTFDALVADGRQVVVTTDCHPRLAEELMPELVDRLLGGAIWGLLPPDDETRLGILRHKSATGSPPIPDEVLRFLAENLRGNVRELEGAVNGIRHFARVTDRPVTPTLAREALGDLLRHTIRAITVSDIDAAVCGVLRLSAGTLQSTGRSWSVSHPRMLAIFLARKHTAATYGEIAKHFGAKTHSTAVAAEKTVRNWLQKDEKLSLGDREWWTKDLISRIERELDR